MPRGQRNSHSECCDERIGSSFPCGIITRFLRKEGLNRARRVAFRCAHCGKNGKARLTEVRSGRVKSCGCLKRKRSIEYTTRHALKLPAGIRKQIFDMRTSGASYQQVAQETGVRYRLTVDRVVYLEKQNLLASVPASVQQSWLSDVREGNETPLTLSQAFGYSAPAIRILLKVRRAIERESEGARTLSGFLWELALVDIYGVLGDDRRELSRDEIVFRRNGSVGGPMAYILALPREGVGREVSALFARFDALVENTRRQRADRYRAFIAKWKAERVALAKTAKQPRRSLLKLPLLKPIEIPRGDVANSHPIYAPAPEMEFV